VRVGLLGVVLAAFFMTVPAQANLIVNGDFQAGNTGFVVSGYSYYDWFANGNNPSALYAEGVYTIAPNPIDVHSYWVDLSTGPNYDPNNLMMIVNGATGESSALWEEDGIAAANGKYDFSADVMDICCNSTFPDQAAPSTIIFQVSTDGGASWQDVASYTTNPGFPAQSGDSGIFELIDGTFIVTGGDFDIRAVDTNNAASGNDFALDNIAVNAVPEPLTLSLFGAGIIGVAGLRRRRKNSVRSL
jgi:PEP-CTERM motif